MEKQIRWVLVWIAALTIVLAVGAFLLLFSPDIEMVRPSSLHMGAASVGAQEYADYAVVEVSIDELSLERRGELNKGGKDETVFRFGIQYPVEDVALLESVKSFSLREELPTEWSEDFGQALLFKTALRGRALLTVEAFSVDEQSEWVKRFTALGRGLMGTWANRFSNTYLGVATSHTGSVLSGMVDRGERWYRVGVAAVLLDAGQLPESVELEFEVLEEVKRRVALGGGGTDLQIIVPKGPNGKVRLIIRRLA